MKKLYWLMLKSYIGPFILTFFIALFVLVMQFLWTFIDQLAGKGLEIDIILELLLYLSATLVPLALPIAILLSSIMTMGSVAEHLELVAAKAAGISLMRVMRPLIVMSVATSIFAFLFANHTIPVALYKLQDLKAAIARTKPAIDVQPGQYYEGIQGLVVMVKEKGSDERSFGKLQIYDHTNPNNGAASLTIAQRGVITVSDDSRYLSFRIFDGVGIDDREFYNPDREGLPLVREIFSEREILIDLSGFKINREGSATNRNQYKMMTVGQLKQVEKELTDDLNAVYELVELSIREGYKPLENSENIMNYGERQEDDPFFQQDEYQEQFSISPPDYQNKPTRNIDKVNFGDSFMDAFEQGERNTIMNKAKADVSVIISNLDNSIGTEKSKRTGLVKNQIEWHRKYSLSFACFVMFFVGAPLGAIIRKGGLGWPMIFCIVIFIIYYVISTIGEKSAKQLAISPFLGMWISTLVLMPFGLFLTLKASTDSSLFVGETYIKLFKKVFGRR